ncbi:hypothetical protein HYV89_00560 [Candidatus Woesearchaeota archaeon]|nr:hypothetical protein [Candidatus Woesearchaeota archaeon]
MKFNTYFGKPIKGAYEDYIERAKNTREENNREAIGTTGINSTLENPRDYIQIPGINGIHRNPIAISKFEVQGMNGKNYEDTHRAVFQLEKGLYIPTPAIFMQHFKNIIDTYQNNQTIFDASGNPISKEEHEEIYRHLTTDFKDIYGNNQPGAWTWLNAGFVQGTGFNNLDLETIIGINADGTFKTRKEPLLPCLNKDAYAEIMFNAQGIATTKTRKQEYKRGENIYFYNPVKGAVAGFRSNSGRADLGCGRNPAGSNSSLGVRAARDKV